MADSSILTPDPVLPQGAGYGVIVGFGLAFALGMVWTTRALKKSFNEDNKTTETFMVANRRVGTGLTASAVISVWMLNVGALVGVSMLTYRYGVAPAVWFGSSGSVMICLMSLISIEAKRKAPNAHTMLEIIRVRYGTAAHVLWIFLALLNNFINWAGTLIGTADAVHALTGMDVTATTYLLPLGVAVYTYFGGLRATFLTDYVHTFAIMIVIGWITMRTLTIPEVGSFSNLYDVVQQVGRESPVDGNYQGSFLTMRSEPSFYFAILHILANCGVAIMDTGFWQKGFSADVAAAVPGYVLGGISSFMLCWGLGTVVGLGALVLERTPLWPTYPRRLTPGEINQALILPYVAQSVAGKAGAFAILLTVFMSTTSISSAELIATSSIFSFDVYGTYINKKATNAQYIKFSHIGVVVSVLFVATLATAFKQGGININWFMYCTGTIICPGVIPTCLALLWKGQTKAAAITAPIVGMICGFGVWLGTAYHYYGEITVASTGGTMPCLFANLTSFFLPLVVSLAISFAKPHSFDFSAFSDIQKVEPEHDGSVQAIQTEQSQYFTPERVAYMNRMKKWALFWTVSTVLGHILLWPLPMYGARMVFSKKLFIAWIVFAMVGLWLCILVSTVYPLIDGGLRQIWIVLHGKKDTKQSSGESFESDRPSSPSVQQEQVGVFPKNLLP